MKFKSFVFYLSGLFVFIGFACQQNGSVKDVKLVTPADSASYSIGLQMGDNIGKNLETAPGGDQINIEILSQAFLSSAKGEETKITLEEADAIIRTFFQGIAAKESQKNLEEGNAFLEKNKAREGVSTTESGLQYEILSAGDGPKPKETDKVKVHYHGTLIDGTVFDSSVDRGEPATFPVNGVIKGWIEGLQLMPVGSKWKFFIPSDIAYGERGSGGKIGPNTMLIFEVELLEIVK
jgi:FKBP-type peptidyl-prolyl cis-trans isomerase